MFIYYKFLDKFHCEPHSWNDLFEYLHYNKVAFEIDKCVQNARNEDGK